MKLQSRGEEDTSPPTSNTPRLMNACVEGREEGSGGRQCSHGGVSDNRITTNLSQVNAFIVRYLPISVRKATLFVA